MRARTARSAGGVTRGVDGTGGGWSSLRDADDGGHCNAGPAGPAATVRGAGRRGESAPRAGRDEPGTSREGDGRAGGSVLTRACPRPAPCSPRDAMLAATSSGTCSCSVLSRCWRRRLRRGRRAAQPGRRRQRCRRSPSSSWRPGRRRPSEASPRLSRPCGRRTPCSAGSGSARGARGRARGRGVAVARPLPPPGGPWPRRRARHVAAPAGGTRPRRGSLQGAEVSGGCRCSCSCAAGTRCIAGAGAAAAGRGVSGVLVGTMIAAVVAARRRRRLVPGAFGVPPLAGLSALGRDVIGSSTSTAGLLVFVNLDVLLARHDLPAAASGLYAVGSIFTKVTFWGPAFLATLLYPRMAAPAGRDRAVVAAVALTAGLGGVVVLLATGCGGGRLVALAAGLAVRRARPTASRSSPRWGRRSPSSRCWSTPGWRSVTAGWGWRRGSSRRGPCSWSSAPPRGR